MAEFKTLTYEDLINGINVREKRIKEKQEKWEFYRAEAANLKGINYSRRMAVAEIALRAIAVIKKGKRGKNPDTLSISAFCREMPFDRRTLADWIAAKTYVFDLLDDEQRMNFQVSDAIAAAEKFPTERDDNPQKVIDFYKRLRSGDFKRRERKRVREYLTASLSNLAKGDPLRFNVEELEEIQNIVQNISARIYQIKKLLKIKGGK